MAKLPKRSPLAHAEFVFEVRAPSWSYSFGLQREHYRPDPYEERQSLVFMAACLFPDQFKGRDAEVTLYGRRGLIEADRQQQLKGAASVVATKSQFELWADLPSDVCWQIGAGISAGSVRYLLANAPVFTPKHSFINSLLFEGPAFDAIGYIG